MTAIRVHENVWWVGGTRGADSSHDVDSHCYLVIDGGQAALVDVGSGLGQSEILRNLESVIEFGALTAALVTHYHADHAGGAGGFLALGAPVFGSSATVDAIAGFDEGVTQLAAARAAGLYPRAYRPLPAPGARVVRDGDRIRVGGIVLEVHETPGHCDGHLCVSATVGGRTILFSGDLVFAGGRIHASPIPDCRLDLYAASVARMAALRPDVLLPGHGEWVLDHATRDLLAAVTAFESFTLPPLMA